MKKNSQLKTIYEKLKDQFDIDWYSENILFVYFESEFPAAQIVFDDNYPGKVLISVNTMCTDPPMIASLTLGIMYVANLIIAEPFYMDAQNKIYFGDEAYTMRDADIGFQHSEEDKDRIFH